MGKKRIVKKTDSESGAKANASSGMLSKKRFETGRLYVHSSYNNTTLTLTDEKGNVVGSSSSGALGFKGAKKGTPFAAAKAGEVLSAKAQAAGMKKVIVVIKGVGSGRESSVRSFVGKGMDIVEIRDETPIPFNGPRPKKPRRV